jgi:phage terminase small subunit
MPLNAKQAAFVREYLVDLNATQAAIRAGYSARTAKVQGSRLLTNADVEAAIAAGTQRKAERAELSAAYVLTNLQEVVERSMQRAPVMVGSGDNRTQAVDEDGNHVWEFNANGANKALELLGKHLELFTEKVKNTHSFEDLTDEQLEARYLALAAKRSAP